MNSLQQFFVWEETVSIFLKYILVYAYIMFLVFFEIMQNH